MTDTDGTLALPTDNLLDADAWRERTDGAFKTLRERIDAEIDARRRARIDADLPDAGQAIALRESDVAPLVKDVFGVSEVLRDLAAGFKNTADHLDGAVQEEVAEVVADHDYGRIVIGDLGTDIVAGWSRGSETVIDAQQVITALAAMYRKRLLAEGEIDEVAELLVGAYRQAFTDAIAFGGKVEFGSTMLKGLQRQLQGTGDDDIAGMVESAMTKAKKDPKFTIKREEQKARR